MTLTKDRVFKKLYLGCAAQLLLAIAASLAVALIYQTFISYDFPTLAFIVSSLPFVLVIGYALFTAGTRVYAALIRNFWRSPIPVKVYHVTRKTLKAQIEKDGVIKPGGNATNLGPGVYVRQIADSGKLSCWTLFTQSVSFRFTPPFFHFTNTSELTVIEICVRNPERLVQNSLKPPTWVVWGPIHRGNGHFEI